MKKIIKSICAALAAGILLSGCYSEISNGPSAAQTNSPVRSEASAPVATYPAPHVFSRSSQAGFSMIPADDGGFFYADKATCLVNHISPDGVKMVMCGVGGCTHRDGTCPAYFQDMTRLSVYGENLYVVTEKGSELKLIGAKISGGSRKELCRWSADKNSTVTMSGLLCSADAAYCVISYYDLQNGSATDVVSRISLPDGREQVLRSFNGGEIVRLMGVVDRGLILETCSFDASPIDITEYLAEHPGADDDYSAYQSDFLAKNAVTVLELVSSDGSTAEEITNSKKGYVPPADARICRDQAVTFLEGNKLNCYDTAALSRKTLAEGELINYCVFDGRAWQISKNGSGYRYVLTDMETGKTMELKTSLLPLGPYDETDDYFICASDSGANAVISKQDLYAEAFDKAVELE